ncbi:hypothetical protein MMC22_001492 [Lobaria immixta]|nr:hypothetical protein [Lobaria immixta]
MECFHCTAGLEQPASKFFDNNLVVSGPGTALADRPQSQRQIKFKIAVSVPHLTIQPIELLVEKDMLKPQEIAIVTPYRAPNNR